MEEIKEDDEEDSEEGERNTGNWGQQYESVDDYFSKQAAQAEDDWQPSQADNDNDEEDLPRFGKPDNKQ